MSKFNLIMPDGSNKVFEEGTTPLIIAKNISISLAKKALIAKIDKKYIGLNKPINVSGHFKLITKDDGISLSILRYSTSLLLASALRHFYPKINFGIAESTTNGFYYDTDNLTEAKKQVSVDEFPKIENEMKKISKANLVINTRLISKDKALEIFRDDPYKTALVKGKSDNQKISIVEIGNYIDLKFNETVPSTNWIKHFALTSVAGAYWRGKSDNPMMQRIYGISEWKNSGLLKQKNILEERRQRDHRTIGKQMDLFFISQEIGAGLPIWLPNGAAIRRTIEAYLIEKERQHGYMHVYTPVISNLDIYKRSGHWDHYRDDMFPPMISSEGEKLELRPMNCPSHIEVYEHKPRSYRDLPFRVAEFGQMHRWEKSGALTGLSRVREMVLNDGHTFVSPEQVEPEFKKILKLIREVYADFGFTDKDYRFRLSYRDTENKAKYFDDDAMWDHAQKALKGAMDDMGLDYFEANGEAAFYGPKLDVQFKTALGNEETMSTIQLDFLLPERFDLGYTGKDNKSHRPVMIHRGVVGTMERFVAFLIEKYQGRFPTWLAPVQAVIIPVNHDKHKAYGEKLHQELMKRGLRVNFDNRDEKMNYLIRDAQVRLRVPYILVVGNKEINSNSVSVRIRGSKRTKELTIDQFEKLISNDIANYSNGFKKVQETMDK